MWLCSVAEGQGFVFVLEFAPVFVDCAREDRELLGPTSDRGLAAEAAVLGCAGFIYNAHNGS